MSEEKRRQPNAIQSMFNAIKKDQTGELIEAFTSEMTLVAEGLVDDQARLRHEVKEIGNEQTRLERRINEVYELSDGSLRTSVRALDDRIKSIEKRLDGIEKRLDAAANAVKDKKEKLKEKSVISQLIILASIICGSMIIISVLQILR